ncbi:N-acetylmuramoyl-L-alanine amidase [Streptacidiphilus sp. MAP5-3]|uniref:N-acetylmuramoyl-L-alanine amidase n=1 Tax=unclassified Streptacidiphilus TaxID=2643834 RepID=UPI00351944D4
MGATGALIAAALVAGAVAEASTGGGSTAAAATPSLPVTALQSDFAAAATEFHVPQQVLMALGYEESLWDTHQGSPSTTGNYNVMGLTKVDPADLATPTGNSASPESNGAGDGHKRSASHAAAPRVAAAALAVNTNSPALHTLDAAAKLIGQPTGALRTDSAQSIRGGAALLASYEQKLTGSLPGDPGGWYPAVAEYAHADDAATAKQFADRVFQSVRTGLRATTDEGQVVTLTADPQLVVTDSMSSGTLAAKGIAPKVEAAATLGSTATPSTSTTTSTTTTHAATTTATTAATATAATPAPECPTGLSCDFVPADYSLDSTTDNTDYGNYALANRSTTDGSIRYIVIHDTESTKAAAVNGFQDPTSFVSAHYVIGQDGSVTQMVPTADMAWHSDNKTFNTHSVGIEHEGWAVTTSSWYTPSEYQSSATLVKYLAARFNIPLDRQHIIGHDEVPGIEDSYLLTQHWDPGPYWNWNYYMSLLGAPLHGDGDAVVGGTVTIAPPYATSYEPTVLGCGNSTTACPAHPVNFVYLYQQPSSSSALITDPIFTANKQPTGNQTAWDWTDRATYGETFVVAAVQGDWTAIWYGGQKAWFYNPGGTYAYADSDPSAQLVTPTGSTAVQIWGRAYPDASAYTSNESVAQPLVPLSYTLPAGQSYPLAGPATLGDYYDSNTYYPDYNSCVTGGGCKYYTGSLQYYPISFNHRLVFVRTTDVQLTSAATPAKSTFFPVTPTRVLDTRDGTGGVAKAPIGANSAVSLKVAGLSSGGISIPATGVSAVVLNVTAVNPTASGYVSVYGDQDAPGSVTLMFGPKQIVSNLVTVPVVNGVVDFYNRTGTVDVSVVITGYYSSSLTGGGTFTGIAAAHLLDTRNGTGLTAAGKLGPGGVDTVKVTGGTSGVPSDGTVTAVALDVTAISGTANSYLALYPGGSPATSSTSMSFAPGQIVANTMIVPVDSTGTVKFYNHSGSLDATADVTGYYSSSTSGASYVPITTRHLLDTRYGLGASGAIGAGATLTLPVTGVGAVPTNATGVVLNVTVVSPTANSYVSVYPDSAKTGASTGLDFSTGQSISNMVVVPVVDGKIDFYNHAGSVQVLADVLGFYTP